MNPEIKDQMKDRDKWYGDAVDYWKAISADLEGMLGGFQAISPIDIEGSRDFLREIKEKHIWSSESERALDCGAGIGRVAKHLLMPVFDSVDLLEQNPKFLDKSKIYLGEMVQKLGELIPLGLQDFCPKKASYDMIWLQWVVGHFTDEDFVSCLQRFKTSLKPGGCICIKDNVASKTAIFDKNDSSVMRTHQQFLKIFEDAGLKVELQKTQSNFPRQLFPVKM
eukprot:gene16938-18649_t